MQSEELKMVANFTEKEISKILDIFAKLDMDNTGGPLRISFPFPECNWEIDGAQAHSLPLSP